MESIGKYWIPVFNLLADEINVTIVNPKWVKAVKGNKDDAKDSKWIGELFPLGLVPGSFIPCKEIRILCEYTRYRFKLTCCKRSEKSRFQNAFTVCNVAPDAVVTDMFGKSASAITDYLITSNEFDPDTCKSFLLKSLKKKAGAVVESIEGYQMPPPKRNICSWCVLISKIGTDMIQFNSSKRLCCWVGLVPSNNALPVRKSLSGLRVRGSTSNQHWCNVPMLP